ncbi:MAG: hypothetical protein K9G38_04120 [Bacteroidales bacterium]|nr:hypothetical protein [Bacteroidales bacterium]
MTISRDNYEAYFLDFTEGRLMPGQEKELRSFLESHPDLADELELFTLQKIHPQKIRYPEKESLKKKFPEVTEQVSPDNFDMFCVAYIENDLTPHQRTVFEAYLADHPEAERGLAAFRHTLLDPEHFVFPAKKSLKKRKPGINGRQLWMPLAAAAAIALFVIVSQPVEEDFLDIAALPEPEKKEAVVKDKEPETEGISNPSSATLKVIRNVTSPAPVSSYKKERKTIDPEKLRTHEPNKDKPVQRIAGSGIRTLSGTDPAIHYDQIEMKSVSPITVNSSSLSLIDQARVRIRQAASEVIEEEDDLLWSLASNGLKEINRIRTAGTELQASRNEQGEISGIMFRSRFLNVTAPVNRQED